GDNVLNVYEMSRGDLKIWRDANSNRITDPGELISLWKLNVAEISLEHEVTNDVDENGNFHTLQGSYTKSDGSVHDLTDVFFVSE
ncbi:MAG: hypothetical protein LBQ68_01885, partial [Clostridiales bacterium]|nr:hypothetical protein [Clostridiales bacterium]